MNEIEFLLGALNYADTHKINYDSSHPASSQKVLPLSRHGVIIGTIKLNEKGEFYFEKVNKKGSSVLH